MRVGIDRGPWTDERAGGREHSHWAQNARVGGAGCAGVRAERIELASARGPLSRRLRASLVRDRAVSLLLCASLMNPARDASRGIFVTAALTGALCSGCPAPATPDGGDASTDATMSSDARTDASADASADGGNDLRDVARLTQACAALLACSEEPSTSRVGSCVEVLRLFADESLTFANPKAVSMYLRYVSCADTAIDCRSFQRCVSLDHGAAWCSAHTGHRCDGTTAVDCATSGAPTWATSAFDCATIGQQCRETTNDAICTTGVACSANEERCDGARLLRCRTGSFQSSIDCSQWPGGGTCLTVAGDGGVSTARCVAGPLGRPNCTSGISYCARDRLRGCIEVGLPEIEVDCAASGGRCERPDGGNARCAPVVSECGAGVPDRCEGGTLMTCVDGLWRAIPCESVWRSRCAVVGTTARCTD
jgi:hypothetical protein